MLSDNKILVSVIIPCRNEEKYIGMCIDSIINNDYPKDKLEVLVVDGMSEDGTREIVDKYIQKYSFIRVLNNVKKIVSTALNIGIQNSQGEIIVRMDAHNVYSNNYISQCVHYLSKYNVDNVGGRWITVPGNNTFMAQSIASALSHPFGIGNAYFRIGTKKPKYVDTVPFGCYKKDIFNKIGFFDEDLIRNQDDELNLRLSRAGGKILLVPDIISYYYARDSLIKLWKMYFQYGYFKPLVAKKIGAILTWRQLIPALFVTSLVISGILSIFFTYCIIIFLSILFSYLIANIYCSALIALQKGLKYIFSMPFVFLTLHFSYGWGYVNGIWDFIVLEKNRKNKIKDIPLTR